MGKFNSDRYKHIGYCYPSVPLGWVPLVQDTIIKIEKAMWPWYLPRFLKLLISKLATDHSVVRVRSYFWYRIKQFFTKGQTIMDIKEKYATLRIYGYYGAEIEAIINEAEKRAVYTCAVCGKYEGPVKTYLLNGWWTTLCDDCRDKLKDQITFLNNI